MSKYHNLLLLTGAGFTKNFGGFLASEMWSQIYNHPRVQESSTLRDLLQEDFDYESIYSQVVTASSTFSEADSLRIQTAVESAYTNLDNAIKDWVFTVGAPYPVCWYTMNRLFQLFNSSGSGKGLFFTLNQDLFMERQSGMMCPGVPPIQSKHGALQSYTLEKNNHVLLPPQSETDHAVETSMSGHAGYVYIKLHGSYGWKSSNNSSQMVLGRDKLKRISDEPILKKYFQIFEEAISEGNKKILVIGYGFSDPHINSVLAHGARDRGLKIYVISHSSPQRWKEKVGEDLENAGSIIKGLAGYFPYSLLEMFPSDQSETIHFKSLKALLMSP